MKFEHDNFTKENIRSLIAHPVGTTKYSFPSEQGSCKLKNAQSPKESINSTIFDKADLNSKSKLDCQKAC